MNKQLIPWASTSYWGNEEAYVLDALKSTWISGGSYVDKLEKEFADFCDTPYAITSSNGTTAIQLAYIALDIKPNDEIIVPGFGFMAVANVALNMGAKPVFCDVDSDTWCMSAQSLANCITPNTKAIVPVHTYGNVCDMDAILEVASHYNIPVIEDAAEAIGSKYKGKMSGTMGILGTYSFHATKTITTGEGGAIVTNDKTLSDKMKLYRSHGMSSRRYWHDVAGHNFRLTNMQAALGCGQLEQIEKICTERARVYHGYVAHLGKTAGVTMQTFNADVDPLVWAIAIRIDPEAFPQGRDALIQQLLALGIETRPGFYSANFMPHIYGQTTVPTSKTLSEHIISLPSSPSVTNDEIEYICSSLVSLVR